MRKILSLLACFSLLFAFGASEAMAFGLGLAYNQGSGTSDIEADGVSIGEYDFDTSDIGLVMDTNLSMDSTFNYRLTLTSASAEYGNNLVFDDLSGFTMTHDFGFGIVKQPGFRLWMGPELRLSWISGDGNTGLSELDVFSFGLGPVLGGNINIGETFTIALTASYLFQTTNGDAWDNFGVYRDWSTDEKMLFVGLNLIMRLNEY